VTPVGVLGWSAAFLVAASAVVLAGTLLARAADAIAHHTGIGRLWVGSVLLAAATSLPELMIDVSAVRLGAPDLAVGDLFGSSLANMLILAGLDLAFPRKRVLAQATLDHALAACLAISLNAAAALLILVRFDASAGGISAGSVLLAVAYLAGTRAVYRQVRRGGVAESAVPATTGRTALSLRGAVARFAVGALVVLVAAPVLAAAARELAALTGLGQTFLGTWLVGLTTSLPELVSSLAAIRLGAFDLAVGNLFGSNAFNMLIFPVLDLAEPRGSIFAVVDPGHVVSGISAVVLMSLGLAAIVYRAERRFAMLEPSSLLMLLAYALALAALYGTAAS
jgi:cation:H+ antiporter